MLENIELNKKNLGDFAYVKKAKLEIDLLFLSSSEVNLSESC